MESIDWFWTKRLHTLTIAGNAGAIVMLGTFFASYENPLIAVGDYWYLMALYVGGLLFSGLAAFIGMQAEQELSLAIFDRKQVVDEAKELFSGETKIAIIKGADEKLDDQQKRMQYHRKWASTYIGVSGAIFILSSVILVVTAKSV